MRDRFVDIKKDGQKWGPFKTADDQRLRMKLSSAVGEPWVILEIRTSSRTRRSITGPQSYSSFRLPRSWH
jgi:hypothetical protein